MKQSNRKIAVLGLLAVFAMAPTLRAEEADTTSSDDMEEMRATLGGMSSQLNDLKSKSDNGVNFGVNVDLRYDLQPFKGYTAAATMAAPVQSTASSTANGVDGMYAKRVEVEFKAKTYSWQTWHLQFDFAGLKLEDLGVEMNELPLFPGATDWNFDAKVGQFRQPFGIEQQTGSSSIAFSERAMMFGGSNPLGFGKLVTERVMGIHLIHKKSFGPVGYQLQATVANDNGDQNPGSTSLAGAAFVNTTYTGSGLNVVYPFAGQRTDQDPTQFYRVGLDLNFIPGFSKFNLGGSAVHDSLNSAFFASDPTTQKWADTYGLDATLETMGFWHVQGEWVCKNTYAGGNTGGTTPATEATGWFFLKTARAEGWYATSVMEPLKLFTKDPTKLELNFRYDNYANDVDLIGKGVGPATAASQQAISSGLKWSYAGKNYTSINYTTYALNGDFGSAGPANADLWTIQQQFNY